MFRGAYSTAYHALLQRGRIEAGNRVLIHGAAGGIGIPAIQIAKLFGAEVIATASTEEKRAVCRAEGADHAIDYRAGFRDKVMELTGSRGVDIVYDPVNGPTFEESLRCLAWGGRILILGFLGGAPALARTNSNVPARFPILICPGSFSAGGGFVPAACAMSDSFFKSAFLIASFPFPVNDPSG